MPCITCQVLIRTPLVVPTSVAFSTSTSETWAHELFAPRLPMLQQRTMPRKSQNALHSLLPQCLPSSSTNAIFERMNEWLQFCNWRMVNSVEYVAYNWSAIRLAIPYSMTRSTRYAGCPYKHGASHNGYTIITCTNSQGQAKENKIFTHASSNGASAKCICFRCPSGYGTCADVAVANGHLLAVGDVDAVGVGAPYRRRDEQLRHDHVPGVGDGDVHLHAVPHLQVLHDQVGAPPEVQRLQVASWKSRLMLVNTSGRREMLRSIEEVPSGR
jgi:hypothetical protein